VLLLLLLVAAAGVGVCPCDVDTCVPGAGRAGASMHAQRASAAPPAARAAPHAHARSVRARRLADLVDFVVCLGGDGVILHASSLFKRAIPPVVSFHLGSMGFLTNHNFATYRQELRQVCVHVCVCVCVCACACAGARVWQHVAARGALASVCV
jgi:NAD kinase